MSKPCQQSYKWLSEFIFRWFIWLPVFLFFPQPFLIIFCFLIFCSLCVMYRWWNQIPKIRNYSVCVHVNQNGNFSFFTIHFLNALSHQLQRNEFHFNSFFPQPFRVCSWNIYHYVQLHNCIMANPSKLNLQETGFNFQSSRVTLSLTISHHFVAVALFWCGVIKANARKFN